MKTEIEPVTEDEWLIRLVWGDRLRPNKSPIISPAAFEPRRDETDGISLFRRACLHDPVEALEVMVVEKRDAYAIVEISTRLLGSLGLSVRSAPVDAVPGHVVVPEINSNAFNSNRAVILPIMRQLAIQASDHVLRRPRIR